jgi:general stress protein 26
MRRPPGTAAPIGGWFDMADPEKIERVWDIIEKIGVGMLTTRCPAGLRGRPLDARPDRDAAVIWFLTDARSGKDPEIEAEPDIGLVFIDPEERIYLSVTARAYLEHDATRARKIWKPTDRMWWEGPGDPNLRVLRVEPHLAELWDGPASTAAVVYEIAKSRITGKKPNLGENRKATIKL